MAGSRSQSGGRPNSAAIPCRTTTVAWNNELAERGGHDFAVGHRRSAAGAASHADAGSAGHGDAWRIAPRRSSPIRGFRPAARAIIRDLLEPGESLADASTWADEHNREIRGSTSWHFVNVPIWAPHYDPRDCRPQGCVVSKIAEFRAILLDHNAPRRPPPHGPSLSCAPGAGPAPADARSRPKRPGRQYPPASLRAVRQHESTPGLGFRVSSTRAFRNEDDLMRQLEALANRARIARLAQRPH